MTKGSFVVMMMGVLWLALGLILADIVVGEAGSPPAEIGSFSGASSVNDIIPIVYYFIVAAGAAGMIGIGAYSAVRGRR